MNINTTRHLLAGLAIGDSLGSTSEFKGRSEVEKLYDPKGWPFKQVGGGAFGWKPGAATDDTDMAMAIINAAVDAGGKPNPLRAAHRFKQWLNKGPRDVGGTTRSAINLLGDGGDGWETAGLEVYKQRLEMSAANGSLMRNGVIPGIAVDDDLNMLFRATVQHSIITHAHPLAVLTCAVQSWIIADELCGWEQGPSYDTLGWVAAFHRDWTDYWEWEDDPAMRNWVTTVKPKFQAAGEVLEAADFDPDSFNPYQELYIGRAGYCLLTLEIGVWAMHWSERIANGELDRSVWFPKGMPKADEMFARTSTNPYDVLSWVAMIGYDADTYGAVAGPLVAAAAEGDPPAYLTDGLQAIVEFDRLTADAKIQ